MPILWRYLLRTYLQVFFLCTAGFISILLVTRFEDIAKFVTTGAPSSYVLLFMAFQIPFILPLAIPISCFIASILLFQRLSRSNELTALRASGLGTWIIIFPLIALGGLSMLVNFTIVSEIAPKCRAHSKTLAYQMTSINPLCLLQKETLVKLKNTYVDMKILKSGKYAEDVFFITRNFSNQRLAIMIAKKLYLDGENLTGSDLAFISMMDSKKPESFDHLIIENQAQMHTKAPELAKFLRSQKWHFNLDYLNLRMLQAKCRKHGSAKIKFNCHAWHEIGKRVSLALAAFSFTLIGAAFGLEISRTRKLKGLVWAVSLATFYLISFVCAKSLRHLLAPALTFYFLPHFLILFFCFRSIFRFERGLE